MVIKKRDRHNVEDLRKAREDSWLLWDWLARHFGFGKDDAPRSVFDRVSDDLNLCPLCTLFVHRSNCLGCPLYESGNGCISSVYWRNNEVYKWTGFSLYSEWCSSVVIKTKPDGRNLAKEIADIIKDWDIDGDGGLSEEIINQNTQCETKQIKAKQNE